MKFEELECGALFMYNAKIYLKVKTVSVPFGGLGDTMLVNAHGVGINDEKWVYCKPRLNVYEIENMICNVRFSTEDERKQELRDTVKAMYELMLKESADDENADED